MTRLDCLSAQSTILGRGAALDRAFCPSSASVRVAGAPIARGIVGRARGPGVARALLTALAEDRDMTRFLMIDGDRAATQALGLACLAEGVGVVMAENLCEGVRALLGTSVSLVVVDAAELRLGPREHATLFERVAPGVDVVAVVPADASLDARVAYELAGFRVLSRPAAVEDLLDKAAAPAAELSR